MTPRIYDDRDDAEPEVAYRPAPNDLAVAFYARRARMAVIERREREIRAGDGFAAVIYRELARAKVAGQATDSRRTAEANVRANKKEC